MMERRLLIAGGALGIGLCLVLGRLVQLTTVQHSQLARQASFQHQQRITLHARRGAIVDRHGEPLALSVPAEALFVHPKKLSPEVNKKAAAIAAALHVPLTEVSATLRSHAPFVWLKRRATPQEAAQVRALEIPGIESIEVERRFYPQGTLAAPLLGFADIDARGIAGIEQAYDAYLREEPAKIVGQRDGFGRPIFVQGTATPPEPLNVRLTLDVGLQYIAEQELAQAVRKTRANGGSVVILDPQTFAVLALAQVPTFNPNAPAAVRPEVRRNRIISDPYEPGSTFKVLLAAAALDAKRVHPQEKIFCEYGKYPVGKFVINDHHPYGALSFIEVLQHSSNIGMAKVGERLGKETYVAYLRAFGLGRPTGLTLPGESAGLLPSPASWSRIHLVTASFGQGLAVTPLQLACAYAAIANEGVLMRPYVVREILNAEGKVIEAYGPQRLWQAVRSDTAQRVLEMMEKVVAKEGTGWRAQIDGFRVAGKTGTSQKPDPRGGYSSHARVASFVGIVPADRPRLVVLVAIDEPKTAVYGGEVAAPVFKAIAQQALAHLGIDGNLPKTEEPAIIPLAQREREPSARPRVQQIAAVSHSRRSGDETIDRTAVDDEANFLGMSLREAVLTAQRNDWQITTQGSGYVIKQTVTHSSGKPVYALTLAPTNEAQP
jgi:cell division protein FtsI (penicillin-binding protein 3)